MLQNADPDTTLTIAERTDAIVTTALDLSFWLAIGTTALRVALLLGVVLGLLSLLKRGLRRWRAQVGDLPPLHPRKQRVMTASNLIISAARYLLWSVVTIMILAEIGMDIGPLLAGAGVAGLAIGFGAQTLVRDVISGLFLLFDDIIHVGDLITFNGQAGTVESISLRLIKVRRFDGELVMVPAGELRTFGNKSIGFQRAVVPIGVTYEQDTAVVLRALERIAEEWAEIEGNRAIMLEDAPQVQALMDLGDSAVTARIVVQVKPGEQFQAERDLRLLVKQRFDEWGLEIPFPRRTVYVRNEPDPPSRTVTLPPRPKRGTGDSDPSGSD